mmetsp:Transcript_19826/g.42713  ORF Transcript_19826/g.42713 Transcript_19826/m.42713 type:complete len:580 (+) Transcript_19826:78-1817(+)
MSSPGAASASGVAGRTNYRKWDQITSDLIDEVEKDEQDEKVQASEALGHSKHASSQAEADEMVKAAKVERTKQMLDEYKKREEGIVQTFKREDLFDADPSSSSAVSTSYITRDKLEAGKRVLTLTDITGPGKIVLTEDLSNLESAMPSNSRAKPKTYDDDAENDVVEERKEQEETQTRKIYGLIKLHLHNLKDCTVVIKCKIITSTIEISDCQNVTVKIESGATVATVQADLCDSLTLEFWDAPSNKNLSAHGIGIGGGTTKVFWGEDKDDRILHAGVSNLCVSTYRDGYLDLTTKADYKALGAKKVGNASPEEMQFVTSVVNGELITEKVARNGGGGPSSHGGSSARVMTEREVEEERKRKENAPCPENLIRFIDVNEQKQKQDNEKETKTSGEDAVEEVEEIYSSMTKDEIDAIVRDCDAQKAKANESFVAGEYAQAVLLYSLVLDRCAELPDSNEAAEVMSSAAKNSVVPSSDAIPPMKQLFPRHVILSNRSACFLKLGEHEKALKDAEDAVALDPAYVKAAFRKGLALHAMSRYQEAVPALGAAHKIEPRNKQIKQALQFAEVRLQQEMRKRMEG